MRCILVLSLVAGLLPASTAASQASSTAVIERLSGRFLAEPAAGPEAPSGRLHALMASVTVPALPGRTIYLQWRDGGPDGRVTRQRLWTFVDLPGGGVRMKFYGFRDGTAWVDAHLFPDRLAALTVDQLIAYPENCDLPWIQEEDGFKAAIPEGCRIVTQRTQRTMDLFASIRASADGFQYSEAGRLEDGTMVFQVPPQGAYSFRRMK